MVKERSIDGGAGRCVSLRRGILRSDPARASWQESRAPAEWPVERPRGSR